MKLEIKKKKNRNKAGKFTNMETKQYILNKQCVKKQIKKEIKIS